MPNRRLRNTTILAKIGVTYGTDVVPTGDRQRHLCQ